MSENKHPAVIPLTETDILAARQSVDALNRELCQRIDCGGRLRLIAWISDIHLHADRAYAGLNDTYSRLVDTRRQFQLALHEVSALAPEPELLILGGDLTEYGLAEELLELDRLLSLNICSVPTLPLFGNHDNPRSPIRGDLQAAWAGIRRNGWPALADPDELYYAVVLDGLKLIVLDTQESSAYKMLPRQREWLQAELAAANTPTLIFCHRHQLPVGNWVDEASLFRDKEVWQWMDRCPHVLGVFSGHVHLPRLWQYRNKLYGTFPSTAYGVGAATGWGGILLDDDRIAGVFWKELTGDGYELYAGLQAQAGGHRWAEPELFQNHRLFNPCYWPWERNRQKRD